MTLSQLTVQLTPEDDGKKLVCRVENSALGPASAVEDSWLLDVYCKLNWISSSFFSLCCLISTVSTVEKNQKTIYCTHANLSRKIESLSDSLMYIDRV